MCVLLFKDHFSQKKLNSVQSGIECDAVKSFPGKTFISKNFGKSN
jgi:hypothetical protein